MRKFMKLHWKKIILLKLLMISFIGYFSLVYVKNNIDEVSMKLLKKYVADISHRGIEFNGWREITAKHLTIRDKKQKLILAAPEAKIKLDIKNLLRGRITEIYVERPYAYVELGKKRELNFIDTFSRGGTKKPGTTVPIEMIVLREGTIFYRDKFYDDPVEKWVYHVDGYVDFDKKKGIDLDFNNGLDEEEAFGFSYSNFEKEKSMNIRLGNLTPTNNLMQYAYTKEFLDYKDGKVDLDLTIDSDGLFGEGKVYDLLLKTPFLKDEVRRVNGDIDFVKDIIDVDLKSEYRGENLRFALKKVPKEMKMTIQVRNIDKEDLQTINVLDQNVIDKVKLLDIVNIDYLNTQLIFDEDMNLITTNYISVDEISQKGMVLKDIKGNMTYANNVIGLKDVRFRASYTGFKDIPIDYYMIINGKYEKTVLDLKYSSQNLVADSWIKAIKGDLKFDFEKLKAEVIANTNLVDIKTNLDLKEKVVTVKAAEDKSLSKNYVSPIRLGNDFIFSYDYGKREIIEGKGHLKLRDKKGIKRANVNFYSKKHDLFFKELDIKLGPMSLDTKGALNLKNFGYDFVFNARNIEAERFLKRKDFKSKINMSGVVKGVKSDLKLMGRVKNTDIKYLADLKNIDGRLEVSNSKAKGLNVDFDGEAGDLFYDKINLKDVRADISYRKGLVKIRDVGNRLIRANGDYDLTKGKLDLSYYAGDITEKKIPYLDGLPIKLRIDQLNGKVLMENKKLFVTGNLKKGSGSYGKGPTLPIHGKFNFDGKKLFFNKLSIDKSLVKGSLIFPTMEFDLKLNIFSENFPKYYGGENLKYTFIGDVSLWGKMDNFKSISEINLKNVYFKGKPLPGAYLSFTLADANIKNIMGSGNIDVSSLALLTPSEKKIIELEGDLALKNNYVSLKTKTERVDLSKLNGFIGDTKLSGSLGLNLALKGPLKKLKYFADFNSRNLGVNDIKLGKFDGKLNGDFSKVNLNSLKLGYLGNELDLSGSYGFKDKSHDLRLISNAIDLSFLNMFSGEAFNNIRGIANVNLRLQNGVGSGNLRINRFYANIMKDSFKLQNVSMNIALSKKQLKINKFYGILNSGSINLDGYLNVPNLSKLKKESIKDLDYALNLKLNRVNYNYGDDIGFNFSSRLNLKNNKLLGNLFINSGVIKGLPPKAAKEIEKGIDEDIERKIDNKEKKEPLIPYFTADIDVSTSRQGVTLEIPQVDKAAIVSNLFGKITTNGLLRMRNKDISYLGNVDLTEGGVTINGNDFKVGTAAVRFVNESDKFPEIHPYLDIHIYSVIADREVNLHIDGDYPDLHLVMRTPSGLTQEEITTLLVYGNVPDEASSGSAAAKGILDSQIDRLFNPISSKIGKALNLDKFKISSDITAHEYLDGVYKETGQLGPGIEVELEKAIIKDELYWKGYARWGSSKLNESSFEYDVALEKRFEKGYTISTGAGQVPEGRSRKGRNDTTNYHVDIAYTKRYDSLSDIFIDLIPKKWRER